MSETGMPNYGAVPIFFKSNYFWRGLLGCMITKKSMTTEKACKSWSFLLTVRFKYK